ncbi:DUF4268 domain-containing protein [Microbacterium awajiense]|uniref:DUF4268 domain-containing protein n=1 Tax=Microbacterium awajiense TaxID=415214 RepID=A0ABP7AVI2_9MICO
MSTLGRLQPVSLREVWAHEALDFTQWLAKPDNLEQLGEALGIELYEAETEVSVGRFFVDILATDDSGRKVVIENQLAATDHDHLGKIITYAAGLGAEVIVWVAETAKEEHQQAVEWLNENTTSEVHVFLVQIEAWRIGDSLPAPRFNPIAKPNDWAKDVRQSAASVTQVSEVNILQREFFERVREFGLGAAPRIKRWQTPKAQHWFDVSIGTSQAHISLTTNSLEKRVAVEIHIPNNKQLFADLLDERQVIEAQLKMSLDWRELPERKACRIVIEHRGDSADPGQQAELVQWVVATADSFARVFPGFISSALSKSI